MCDHLSSLKLADNLLDKTQKSLKEDKNKDVFSEILQKNLIPSLLLDMMMKSCRICTFHLKDKIYKMKDCVTTDYSEP